MPEVKRIFNDRYKECDVQLLPEYDRLRYKLEDIDSPIVYSVDCIFERPPSGS